MSEESLKTKTIKGTAWSAADAFLGQGVTFVVGIILARLLSPDEYGLIGICLIFNTVLNGIVDSGFSNALIRKKDVSNEEYNTMFLTNLGISCILYVLLFFSTPLISQFFNRPELTSLISVTSLILFFNALSLTHYTILTKRIDFKTKTKASVASAILSGVIGIGMAYSGFGVWALVGQMVSKQLLYTLALWVFIKWCPKLMFSKNAFKYMWGFGWKMLVSGLLDSAWNQASQIVVGKFYSPTTLGQYSKSNEFASIVSSNISGVIGRVTLPVLAEIQDDKEKMRDAYRRIIKLTMFVTTISLFLLGAIAEPLITFLLGAKWIQAASFLPLICISMSLYPLHAINLNMLKILGRSDLFLKYEILKKIIAIIPICIGIFVGIYAMLVALIITGVISFFINSWYSGKMIGYSSFNQIVDILPNYLIAIVCGVTVNFLKYLPTTPFVILSIQIFIYIFVVCFVSKICNNEQYYEIKYLVIKEVRKLWKK